MVACMHRSCCSTGSIRSTPSLRSRFCSPAVTRSAATFRSSWYRARGPARLGLRAEDLHVDDSLGLAVGSLSAPRLLGPGGALSSTAVFVEGATGAFEVARRCEGAKGGHTRDRSSSARREASNVVEWRCFDGRRQLRSHGVGDATGDWSDGTASDGMRVTASRTAI